MDNSITSKQLKFSAVCNRIIDGSPCGIIHYGSKPEDAANNALQCDHNPVLQPMISIEDEPRTDIPAQPPLLTYQAICDYALDMLIAKVGKLPIEHFVFSDGTGRDSRDGTVVYWQEPFTPVVPGERQGDILMAKAIILRMPLMARGLNDGALSEFVSADLLMPLSEFAIKFISKQIDMIADRIKEDFSGFKSIGIFGKLAIPLGCEWAGCSEKQGFWMRMVRYYDINIDRFPCRFDVIYGGI